jgi:predicted dehydrogenase
MEALLTAGHIDPIAIHDPDPRMAHEAQLLAPSARCVPSLSAMLDLAPDGVVIASPSALHAGQCVQALNAGAAVFCQKPLGRTAAEVGAVLASARAADRLLGVDFSYRFATAARLVRERVRAGVLGDVYAANLVFHNAYGPDKPWFYDPALSGGGCVIDLGIHLVDLALWTLGYPAVSTVSSRLYANGRPWRAGQCEDFAAVSLHLETGGSIEIACSWRLPVGRDVVIAAEFYGTDGGAAIRNVGGSFHDFTAASFVGTRSETLAEPPDAWGGRAAVDWAVSLAGGAKFSRSTSGLAETAALIDRIYAGRDAPSAAGATDGA